MHLSTEANGDQRQNTQTHGSPQTYLVVYVALMGLLLLTVFASSWGLGATWGLMVALSIAVAKALLERETLNHDEFEEIFQAV